MHPADLVEHDCVLYTGSPRSLVFQRTGSGDEPVGVEVRPRFSANNSEVLRDVVLSGAGIGLLPDFSIKHHESQMLEQLLPGWSAQGYFGTSIVAIRPFSPSVPLAVHCLLEHLRQVFDRLGSRSAG